MLAVYFARSCKTSRLNDSVNAKFNRFLPLNLTEQMNLTTTIEVYLLYALLAIFLSIMAKLWWKISKPIIFSPVNDKHNLRLIAKRAAAKRRGLDPDNIDFKSDGLTEKQQQNIQDPAKPPGSTF